MLDDEDTRILQLLADSVEGEIVVGVESCFIDDIPVPHHHLVKFVSLTLVSESPSISDEDRFVLNSTGRMILAQPDRLPDIASAVLGQSFVTIKNGRVIRT